MADALEDNNFDSKKMDSWIFKGDQLSIFKHDFREASMMADDQSYKDGFGDGFRTVAGLARKLGRLKGVSSRLLTHTNTSIQLKHTLQEFMSQVEQLLERCSTLNTIVEKIYQDQSEFDMNFAANHLPDFNSSDMNLFMGYEDITLVGNIISENSSLALAENFKNSLKPKISEIIIECDQLFDKFCPIIHSFGICDEFLYG